MKVIIKAGDIKKNLGLVLLEYELTESERLEMISDLHDKKDIALFIPGTVRGD